MEAVLIYDFILLLIAVIFAVTPYITRKTESFGVSVPASEYGCEDLRRMRRTFLLGTVAIGVLFTVGATFIAFFYNGWEILLIFVIFIELAAIFILYYQFHRKMVRYKQEAAWKDQVSSRIFVSMSGLGAEGKKKPASPKWFALYGLLILCTAGVSLYLYPSIPEQFPVHYDFAGNVTDYAQKSVPVVMFLPMMQVFMTAIFAFVYWITLRAKRVIDGQDPAASARREAVYRSVWANFILYGGLMLIVLFSLIQFVTMGLLPEGVVFPLAMAVGPLFLIISVYLAVRYGQGGSRLDKKAQQGKEMNANDDDRYWIAGVFYFNREDPSLFVEKRFGVGFTSNFARPLNWVFVGVLAGSVIAIIVAAIGFF